MDLEAGEEEAVAEDGVGVSLPQRDVLARAAGEEGVALAGVGRQADQDRQEGAKQAANLVFPFQ